MSTVLTSQSWNHLSVENMNEIRKSYNNQYNRSVSASVSRVEGFDLEDVAEILKMDMDKVDADDFIFGTPLHYACVRSQLIKAKALLMRGANPNLPSHVANDTPLHIACFTGHLELVQLLLRNSAIVDMLDSKHMTALHKAAVFRKADIIKELLDHGADINADDFKIGTPLHWACVLGDVFKVKVLIAHGAKINVHNLEGATPLHLAVAIGETELVHLLIDNGADINVRTDKWLSPLHVACFNGRCDIAEILVESGAVVIVNDLCSGDGITPLHVASCCTDESVASFLLSHGVEADMLDTSGCTALHWACHRLQVNVARCLIAHGANVNAASWKGLTALNFILQFGGCMDGSEVDDEENFDFSWHRTCNKNLVPTLNLMLENGIVLAPSGGELCSDLLVSDSDAAMPDGEYMLDDDDQPFDKIELAIDNGHISAVLCLLKAGYDIRQLQRCDMYMNDGWLDHATDYLESCEVKTVTSWFKWRLAAGFSVPFNLVTRIRTHATDIYVNEDFFELGDDFSEAALQAARAEMLDVRNDCDEMLVRLKSPASLQDICRGMVRHHLISVARNRSIFILINALPLPTTVKDDLKLLHLEPIVDQ